MRITKRYVIYYWAFVMLFLIIAIPLHFYWPFVAQIGKTRQLPINNPGALTSNVWTWSHIREGIYAFMYLIILSGLFMLSNDTKMGRNLHYIVLFIFAILFVVNGAFDIIDVKYGQVSPDDANFKFNNAARSINYCGVHALNPLTARLCANVNLWAVSALNTNPDFIFRIVCNLLLLLFILCDAIFTYCWWKDKQNY